MYIDYKLPSYKEFDDHYVEESDLEYIKEEPVNNTYIITQDDIANYERNSRQGDYFEYEQTTMQAIINSENHKEPEEPINAYKYLENDILYYALEYGQAEY